MLSFFRNIWTGYDGPGNFTFFLQKPREALHVPLASLRAWSDEDAQELVDYAQSPPRSLYFCLGLTREGLPFHRRGGKADIVALPGLMIDADMLVDDAPDAHKAKNLPRSFEEMAPFFDHLPSPSAVIVTPGGIQALWLADEPIEIGSMQRAEHLQKEYRAFQAPVIERAAKHGFQVDRTGSIEHVWRVPGSINPKYGRKAHFLWDDTATVRYSWRELGVSLSLAANTRKALKQIVSNGDLLDRVRKQLKRISPKNRFHGAVQKLLAGESLAERGDRDETLQGVASTVAWLEIGRTAPPDELAELFRPSLEIWAAEEDAKLTIDEELAKVTDKIARSQEDYEHKNAIKNEQLEKLAAQLGMSLETPEGEPTEASDVLKRLIVCYQQIYFVWDFERSRYLSRPYRANEIVTLVNRLWDPTSPSVPADVQVTYVNTKGEEKAKTLDRLLIDYGHSAAELVGDLTVRESSFDGLVFTEALAHLRVTEAKFDPELDEFLRIFAGGKYEMLLDWIAGVPKLQYQCAALCLIGPPGCGKTLLMTGLSRLYQKGGPTPLRPVLKGFNAPMTKCPLVFSDEGLPKDIVGVSQLVRELVGSSTFTSNDKHVPTRTVNGAVRVAIAANNDQALSTNEHLGIDDLKAYADRFFYIRVPEAATAWFEERNQDNAITNRWLGEDGIAKHCLYLAEERAVNTSGRFIVVGVETEMHRKLLMQHPIDNLVLEWLASFAESPERLNQFYTTKNERPKALIGNGALSVNTRALLECWGSYMINSPRLSTNQVGGALAKLSDGSYRPGRRGEYRLEYHRVRVSLVLEWAELYQTVDVDRIKANLSNKVEEYFSDSEKEDEQKLH